MSTRRLLKAMWLRACRYDAFEASGRGRHRYDGVSFAVFSDENPYILRHDKIMRLVRHYL